MRPILLAALMVLMAAPVGAQTQTLSQPEIPQMTPGGYAAMLRQMGQLEQDTLFCDCAAPSPDCGELCNVEPDPGWICGTHVAEMDRRLREALIRGDHPDVIAELI